MTNNKTKELNDIKLMLNMLRIKLIENEIKLGQYARHEVPVIEFMLESFKLGREDMRKEVLDFINKEKINGNIEGTYTEFGNGFEPALCLSDLIKFIEGELK